MHRRKPVLPVHVGLVEYQQDAQHAAYEWWAMRQLVAHAPWPAPYDLGGPYLESFLLHVRNVLLFLYPDHASASRWRGHVSDLTAYDFLGSDNWDARRRDPAAVRLVGLPLSEFLRKLNQELLHTTKTRAERDRQAETASSCATRWCSRARWTNS